MQHVTHDVADVVARAVEHDNFRIRGYDFTALLERTRLTTENALRQIAECVKAHARPPTSGFYVGAVALGASGTLYLGVNVEIPGVPLNHSIHAEQFALVTAMAHDETKVVMMAASAAPCGHCRQFMNELRDAKSLICVMPSGIWPLADLLPHSFGPSDLANVDRLLLEPQNPNGRAPLLEMSAIVRSDGMPEMSFKEASAYPHYGVSHSLVTKASRVLVETAYAPYSKSPAGICVRTSCGSEFTGWSLESAAYNPSMSPFQCVTARLVACGKLLEDITLVVLIELSNAAVKYESTVLLALAQVAPNARLIVVNYHDV